MVGSRQPIHPGPRLSQCGEGGLRSASREGTAGTFCCCPIHAQVSPVDTWMAIARLLSLGVRLWQDGRSESTILDGAPGSPLVHWACQDSVLRAGAPCADIWRWEVPGQLSGGLVPSEGRQERRPQPALYRLHVPGV